MTRLRLLVLLVPLASLAACHKPPQKDQRSATGEVLQGTTTDAMIPLGQLTSKPPLLPQQAKAPTTPEQAADQDTDNTGTVDVSSETSSEPAAPAPTPTAAASVAP